jgi:hypothetical protein
MPAEPDFMSQPFRGSLDLSEVPNQSKQDKVGLVIKVKNRGWPLVTVSVYLRLAFYAAFMLKNCGITPKALHQVRCNGWLCIPFNN